MNEWHYLPELPRSIMRVWAIGLQHTGYVNFDGQYFRDNFNNIITITQWQYPCVTEEESRKNNIDWIKIFHNQFMWVAGFMIIFLRFYYLWFKETYPLFFKYHYRAPNQILFSIIGLIIYNIWLILFCFRYRSNIHYLTNTVKGYWTTWGGRIEASPLLWLFYSLLSVWILGLVSLIYLLFLIKF